jgi:uncharacterized protein (TIGR01244 family)
MKNRKQERILNFLQLTENIATSGQPTEDQLARISEEGFEIVINLALTGKDYSLEDEAGVVEELGMEYIHLPVIWEDPSSSDFDAFVMAMQANHGKKLYIHCAANMRVSVFMALYRILHLGWEREPAFEDVHKIWKPNEIWEKFVEEILKE